MRENDVVYDKETDELVRFGAEFVTFHEHPVSCTHGINRNGLAEAAGEIARWVQAELHARGDEPLEHVDAIGVWMLRLRYVNALYWLAGDRHTGWKEVEARVAPDGVPRSICIGSGEEVPVQVVYFGRGMHDTMHGYRGCLRTFHVKPHGRGRPWATWCPACRARGRKSNHRERAKREYQRRIAEIGRPSS